MVLSRGSERSVRHQRDVGRSGRVSRTRPVFSWSSRAMTDILSDVAGMVDIGGRRLYLECHGSGSSNVVLLSGYGDAGDVWNFAEAYPPPVLQGVPTFARVCTYDRPG